MLLNQLDSYCFFPDRYNEIDGQINECVVCGNKHSMENTFHIFNRGSIYQCKDCKFTTHPLQTPTDKRSVEDYIYPDNITDEQINLINTKRKVNDLNSIDKYQCSILMNFMNDSLFHRHINIKKGE